MDENKLRLLWQNFIIYPPKDPEERRRCLTKLLDICICHFTKQLEPNSIQNDGSTNTRFCIGNWLIHQFIIDIGNASSKQFNSENQFLNDYFIDDIGWKLLKSIYYFNANDALLYNFGLIQLLVPILKQYLSSYSADSADSCEGVLIFTQDDYALSFESFVEQSKFSEQVYLKTLSNDILSPAKVKSWIKSSRNISSNKANNRKLRNLNNSDCDSDEENYLPPRHGIKYSFNNSNRLICSQAKFEQMDLSSELSRLHDQLSDDNLTVKKPTKSGVIHTIVEILIDFVRYEHRFDRQKLSSLPDNSTSKLSLLIIEEFSPIIARLVANTKCRIDGKLSLLRPIKNLVIASTFTACQTLPGVQLISNHKILQNFLKLLKQIDYHIKEANSNLSALDLAKLLRVEYFDLLSSAIKMLIEISKYLIHTKEFATFASLMKDFFHDNHQELLQSLMFICETYNDPGGTEYGFIYKTVDLLLQLQITLQYSQSLCIHKQLCTKRRHKKCDLTPCMVHHLYHERMFGPSKQTTEEFPCFISSIYHVLINLIFICAKRSSENIDKLICHICGHLSSLISCCWSLKPHFNRLLHFAVNSERSNAIRSSIFNIIEFSIRNQRKYLFNSIFVIEKCNFCAHEEMCENGVEFMTENKGSEKSEGYLTDNGNSSTANSKCKVGLQLEQDQCLESNCLIASLSSHYISLLKSDSLSVRQTIFHHLLNLFSYLSNNSKVSLLYHIIFPVFQSANQFPLDVCTFTLRLLIFISDRASQHNDEINLLFALKKVDGFLFLKHLILNVQPFESNLKPKTQSDTDHMDLSLLGIRLLESLVKNELLHSQNNQLTLLTKPSSSSKELPKNLDLNSLSSISLLVELYSEQFNLYKRMCILPSVHGSLEITNTSLDGYVEFYRKACFNLGQMDDQELGQLSSNLVCFLKLLTTSNCILNSDHLLRLILANESCRFSEKLYLFFQQILQLVLNEVKLFRLLTYRNQNFSSQMVNLDLSKYVAFFGKVLRIVEQLLLLLLQIEPFSFNGQPCTKGDICAIIKSKLDIFISDKNLINWTVPCAVDPIQDLLKMFINIAFNSSQVLKCYLKNDKDYSMDIETYISHHPRTSSYDSLMSDNDTNNDTVDVDSYDAGYQADTEGLWSNKLPISPKDKQNDFNRSWLKQNVNVQSVPVLKYIEICQTVIIFLSQSLAKKNQLLSDKRLPASQLKADLDCTLAIVNTLTRNCKENQENCQILFENNFTKLIMNSFGELLTSSNTEDKSIKFAIFDLFIEICKVKLRSEELKLLIDLFKHENADFDFLLSTTHKILFSKNTDNNQPIHSVSYPVTILNQIDSIRSKLWLDSIISNIRTNSEVNEQDQMSLKSLACALPFSPVHIVNFHYSLAFWIYLDKINPLIDKYKTTSSTFGYSHPSKQIPAKVASSEPKSKNVKCIHVISMAFNSSSIELWFDYIYNRFVYRVCKENNGKLIYSSENFVPNFANILGRWNFIRINVEQTSMHKGRSSFVKVNHSTNCLKDEIIKLSYPVNLLEKNSSNSALLFGSTIPTSQFHYKLGNVFLFNQHLQPSSTVFLYSLGADFSNLHHLRSESIVKENYFALPKQLVKDNSVDIISSMYYCISPSLESKLIQKHLIVLYRASQPGLYFTYQWNTLKSSIPFSRFYPQSSSGKKNQLSRTNELMAHKVKFYGAVKCQSHFGVSKTIADSGGISLFLFMVCYLFERCDNQAIYHKAIELLLRVYDSHYQHRFLFEKHYSGHKVLLYVLEKSRKSFSSSILRVFSQFSLDSINGHSVILSPGIEVFLKSWKVWSKNLTTMKLFFAKLEGLVSATNPYRNYNLAQLRRVNAFSRLLNMIKDMYINYGDQNSSLEEIFFLDSESLDHVITIFNSIIDSSSDLNLFRCVFNCILILQKSEWLHVNQTRASFYYLFPSTWLSRKENSSELSPKSLSGLEKVIGDDEAHETSFDLDDWEIVSEMLDGSARVESENESRTSLLSTSNCDLVVNQLLLLVNRFVDQLSEIALIDAIFQEVLCLDFLLVFVNTPSDRVREIALRTYFKFYNLYYKKGTESRFEENNGKTIKDKTRDLLLLANQLYHYVTTEETVLICLSFLLDLNRKCSSDLLNNRENNNLLRRCLPMVQLENFIPFLSLLPKCTSSLGFCYKVLQMLHRILGALSIEQVSELQQDFGLAQSLSKLIINFNTQLSPTADDINKYTKEHVNEEVNKILYEIAQSYLLRNGVFYFNCYTNLLHYFAIMERKVSTEVASVFRQGQVSMLQAAFDTLLKLKNGNISRTSKPESLDILSEQFIHILSGSDILQSDFSSDYSAVHDANLDKQKDRDLVKPKDALERLKFAVKKATCFIVCRDDILLCQKEVYFQREVLFHLLQIVEQAEYSNIKIDSKRRVKNMWSNLFQGSKEFFKSLLTELVLFLISPFQTVQDRIFSLNLLAEKTKTLEYIKMFIDRSNEKFPYLFEAFLVDLMEKGIKDLTVHNYMQEFPTLHDNSIENYSSQDSLSLVHILTKYKSQMNLKVVKSESFYKAEIANWYDQIEERKAEYELSIRKHVNKIFANMWIVFNQVSDSATSLNEKIIFSQHLEKKEYIEHIRKESFESKKVQNHICNLMNESLHEKAFWHMKQYYPQSWALSPFESRNRIRKKLERSFLEIDSRFIMKPSSKLLSGKSLFVSLLGSNSHLFAGTPTNDTCSFLPPDSQPLLYTALARVILFDEEIEGEILLKSQYIQFFSSQGVNTSKCLTFSSKRTFFQDFVINFCEIQELSICRYELQNNALEIYLNSGLTYLIAFESTLVRDEFFTNLTCNREMLPSLVEKINLVTLTQLWRERRISNFDYLIHLNKLSGRTSNDLMQYPVFPFVLADYQSDVINLKDSNSFRIFSRPIAVQKKEREKHYIEQYNYIKQENERNKAEKNDTFQYVVTSAPYHYGSHYSNSGIVLHYLVRLPPYTQMFLQYQDKNFDIPDRTFHSMHTTWRLATEDSTNGFKELIPEFFYLPEFLLNNEQYDLGVRQNGERVNDVILPPWARNCARLFTLINRQALESKYVTEHLNQWIDLTFGYQQSGKPAIDSINVFHPATHFSQDLSKIEDQVRRHAIKTMIKTFGQMPNQLFNMPHPSVSLDVSLPFEDGLQLVPGSMPEVIGLKWGDYVGSPIYSKPNLCFQKKFNDQISRLWALPTNDVLLLPPNSCLLVTFNQQRNIFINTLYIISYSLCIWSHFDSAIWIKNKEEKVLFTQENQFLDKISLCESIPDYDCLLVGYESGLIVAFSMNSHKSVVCNFGMKSRCSFLAGHRTSITSISINKNYSVALSTDSDGVCILWDMSKLQYIRTIIGKDMVYGSAKLTCISDTLGDLAIVSYLYACETISSSKLSVFTINGRPIGDIETTQNEPYITSLCYSTSPEGLCINVIATGLSNGAIKLWSSWDLTLIRKIKLHQVDIPIRSISFSFTNDLLYIVLEDNLLVALENSSSPFSPQSTPANSNRKNFRILDLTYLNTQAIL